MSLVESPTWDRCSWMRDVREHIGPSSIADICLVGTHNSATYAANTAFAAHAEGLLGKPGMLADIARCSSAHTTVKWAQCQSLDMGSQLMNGIRYFDFRLDTSRSGDQTDLYISHAVLSVSLADVLKSIEEFCSSEATKDEFLILDFQAIFVDSDEDMERLFYSRLRNLERKCVPNSVSLSTPLAELWKTEYRLFVFVDRKFPLSLVPFAYPRTQFLTSTWFNKRTSNELLGAIEKDAVFFSTHECPPTESRRVCVTQTILTPVAADVLKGSICCCGQSQLRQFVGSSNDAFVNWFFKWNSYAKLRSGQTVQTLGKKPHSNVLLLDFVEEGTCEVQSRRVDAVELCVILNLVLQGGLELTEANHLCKRQLRLPATVSN